MNDDEMKAHQEFTLIGNGADLLLAAARKMRVGAPRFAPDPEAEPWPRASHLARMAARAPIDEKPPSPLYVRAPDAKKAQGHALARR
jgi:tRNA A37 threonylcarbamoyladenosine modification protein TsaB